MTGGMLMNNEKLKQFLKAKTRFYFVLLLLNIVLVVGSALGISWIAGNSKRTLFGKEINLIETRMLNDKETIEKYNVVGGDENHLKILALRYSELSLGQNFMIRQLIDLGFLGFLFWSGFYGIAISISFKRFTKNIERILD